MMGFKLSQGSPALKVLCTLFLLTMALGYGMAMVNVWDKTKFSYNGMVEHYRGNEEKMIFPKELGTMIEVSHSHLFAHPIMFFVVGLIFVFTSLKNGWKIVLLLLPFAGLIIDVGGMWLTRYVAAGWVTLVLGGGIIMALGFGLMWLFSLYEIWLKKPSV